MHDSMHTLRLWINEMSEYLPHACLLARGIVSQLSDCMTRKHYVLQVRGCPVQPDILFQGVAPAETASIGRSATHMCLGFASLQQAFSF